MLLGQLSVNGHWLISFCEVTWRVYIGRNWKARQLLGEPVFEALFEYETQSKTIEELDLIHPRLYSIDGLTSWTS